MTGVTLEPAPADLVARALCLELTPQVVVLHRFAAQRAPTLDLPTRQPLRDAIAQILGVGKERHLARFLERAQRFNRRFDFHAVVGGSRLATRQLPGGRAVPQHDRPAARTWIGIARAISVDGD